MSTPHPADCDGKCASCPIDHKCSHVRLPDSKIECITYVGSMLFFIFIFCVTAFVIGSLIQ